MRVPAILSWLLGRPQPRAAWGGAPSVLHSTNPIGALQPQGRTGEPWGSMAGDGWPEPQAAEALSAVASCIGLISETIAALPATVVLADDSRAAQPDNPLAKLVVQGANDAETWSDLIATFVASALGRGNGLIELESDDRGRLTGLRSVPWAMTQPYITDAGDIVFDYTSVVPPNAGQRRRLLRSEVIWLKARSDSGLLGISPLQRSANAVQHGITTQRSSFIWMSNAARPGGALTAPGKLSKETADRLKDDWDNNYSGERFAKTAVLPEGLKFEPLGWLSAEDAQIVERLAYTVRDVARIFGVPTFLLADETRSTFASASAALSYFAGNTLLPWITRLERAFQQSCLTSRVRLRFDLNALLKADPDAFAAALLKMRQGGYITANECRAMLGLPAHADGDTIIPPSVMSGNAGNAASADAPAGKIFDLESHRHVAAD